MTTVDRLVSMGHSSVREELKCSLNKVDGCCLCCLFLPQIQPDEMAADVQIDRMNYQKSNSINSWTIG